jgi:MauM/NapG family ferredoxin protein
MKRIGNRTARLVQRLVQTLGLLLFLFLLWKTVWPLPALPLPADTFLHLDPLVAVGIPLAAREILPGLWPGLILLAVTVLAGRIFCGYLCPLGVSLDLVRFLLRKIFGPPASGGGEKARRSSGGPARTGPEAAPSRRTGTSGFRPRHVKYLILAAILGAALVGVNLVFWASPLSLVTRLYSLVLHPLALLAGHELLPLGQSVLASLDMPDLAYAHVSLRRFDALPFVVVLFAALFRLERVKPRFWCRYCCPAGALLALCSLRPLWRRRVWTCTGCGRCAGECPTGAIAPSGVFTRHPECIACRKCTDVCPVRGTRFLCREGMPAAVEAGAAAGKGATSGAAAHVPAIPAGRTLPSRRAFLASAGAGVALAAVEISGARSLLSGEPQGLLWPEACIRPPGALPEPDFLTRCIRCGQCMKACPTNSLQPAGFAVGLEGVFSPFLTPRRGPCEPDCHVCGSVCPTRAITPLPQEEKHWAKVGTAVVAPGRCLAWAEGRRCVVCEEVCPYGAVAVIQNSGARFGVPVPVVRPDRCFGCGYCEYYCPVRMPAIVVQPLGALRLAGSRYAEAGRAAGLSLIPAGKAEAPWEAPEDVPEGALPPGFTE